MTPGIQKISEKISNSANELANVLMKDLSSQTDPAIIRRCVRQLIALHKGKVAQSLFLKNATSTIQKSIKSLPLSKDFITYMEEYTRVTFETIKVYIYIIYIFIVRLLLIHLIHYLPMKTHVVYQPL